MAYDALGNVTYKSDVCSVSNCYSYATPGKPHAVSAVTGSYNGVSNPTFSYDNNGNMVAGAGRTITYNADAMVSIMSQGTTTLCWAYDADKQRVRMDQGVSGSCASPVSSVFYLKDSLSGVLSEKTVSGSNTTFKDYLIVGGAIIGTRTQINSGTPTTNYYVHDYQGSVVATTDETGALICQISYDPWGKSTATGGSCTAPSREYLSQESINTGALYNLINLNARVFDPVLARFLGPDPITDASNLQALNLYSYGMNSPLWISDPSGMHGQTWQWIGIIASIVVFIVAPEAEGYTLGSIFTDAASFNLSSIPAIGYLTANGAVAGAVGAGISGGNVLQGAEFGALSGLAAGLGAPLAGELAGPLGFLGSQAAPIASAFIAQGFTGGLTSVIEGSNFGSGFLAAGVGSLAGSLDLHNVYFGAAVGAVTGGLASVLGGGKFQNGAITGAFGYLASTAAQSAVSAHDPIEGLADFAGKVWNLPNTIIGAGLGGVGYLAGEIMGTNPDVKYGYNAFDFLRNPLAGTAITLGNAINFLYDPTDEAAEGFHTVGEHEEQHTYQGQMLGPLYLPANIIGGIFGLITAPPGQGFINSWHGPGNFMESGPSQPVPRPF